MSEHIPVIGSLLLLANSSLNPLVYAISRENQKLFFPENTSLPGSSGVTSKEKKKKKFPLSNADTTNNEMMQNGP